MTNVQFDEATHTYTVDGKVIPSVTQILSSVAVKGKTSTGMDIWNPIGGGNFFGEPGIAAHFGTEFHVAVKYLQEGREVDYDEQMEPWIKQWQKFYFEQNLIEEEIIFLEKPLISKLGFAGTPDRVSRSRKGVIRVRDWKTGISRAPATKWQVAAYRHLTIENMGLRSNAKIELQAVRFLKDKYVVDYYDYATTWNTFLSILNILKAGRK